MVRIVQDFCSARVDQGSVVNEDHEDWSWYADDGFSPYIAPEKVLQPQTCVCLLFLSDSPVKDGKAWDRR